LFSPLFEFAGTYVGAPVMTKKKWVIAVTIALTSAVAAHAQTSVVRPAYSYPGATPATGGSQIADTPLFFNPYMGLAFGHDDNLFLAHSNKKASNLYIVSPGFKIDARSPGMVFQTRYQGQIGRYTSSSADNYVDQVLDTQLDTAFNQRTFLRLGYDYIHSHDPRGSTDRPIEGRPDIYKTSTPYATFAFGAPGAQGRVELYGSSAHKDYLNNKAVTRFADRDTNEYGGAFYWRVAPKTYVLAEARQTDIRYEVFNPFGGEERRYYGGVSWEATAATTGTFKVGQLRRKFEGPFPSTTATSWEGLISWAPRTYSRFDFYTARQTNESTGLGRFILTSVGGVSWNHDWTSYLMTGVNLRYQRDAYQGFDRTDNTKSIGLKVGYRFRPWLTLGAEYNHATRDSNTTVFEYDKNLYLITATATM
jgi:hypothetical protein